MDEKEGLPSLPDKSKDLGFTDPPWGANIHNDVGVYKGGKRHMAAGYKVKYDDSWNEEFNHSWFKELDRVCERMIIVTGQYHLGFWFGKCKPKGMLIINCRNSVSRDSKIASWNHYTPYLYWGKFKKKLISNVINYTIPWGWLSSKEVFYHPSPKGLEIPLKIFRKLEPESIIDPFAGSGSYIKAADILGIPWLGYEINEVYSHDIDKRFSKRMITEWIL